MRTVLCLLALLLHAAPAGAQAFAALPSLAGPGALIAREALVEPFVPSPEVDTEIDRLRSALAREVPKLVRRTPARDAVWVRRAQAALAAAGTTLGRPQLLVVVDRAVSVQEVALVVARPDAPWAVIGGAKVSTGDPNRRLHYVTPTGVFQHSEAILGFRAQGTLNENGIRGFGVRGLRVWDFGWHSAAKGWRADGERGDIRLLMHGTDPDRLEARLGRPASQGCVRLSTAMNRFLDRHGVLDAAYERAAVEDRRFRALLPADRVRTPLGGTALVVVDSSLPG